MGRRTVSLPISAKLSDQDVGDVTSAVRLILERHTALAPGRVVLISILIPAYARTEQLGEALESIAQQDRSLIGEIIGIHRLLAMVFQLTPSHLLCVAAMGRGEADVKALGPDQCMNFYPFLWTEQGSAERSSRKPVDISEQYAFKMSNLNGCPGVGHGELGYKRCAGVRQP